jgi:chemotaxis protein CheX
MTLTLRDSITRLSDPRNLDASVEEVFGMMLGWECRRAEADCDAREADSLTAMVGFGGVLSGACIVRASAKAALKIAGRMMGAESAEVDDTVQDGIGELCNMLAGSWKGRVPELASNCGLSVPAVITGHSYSLHLQAPKFQLKHIYFVEDISFEVTIVCDGLQ